MTTEPGPNRRRISWSWVALWTGIGVALLSFAAAAAGAWGWTGVSIDILVHIGATLLLAPLLPFLERSLTRQVVRENQRMIQQETAGLRSQVGSLSTRIDQLQAVVDQQASEVVEDEDRIIDALSTEASFMTVASAMAVANRVGALPDGEVTVGASAQPMIDLTFSWQHHMGDGRFSEPTGDFLAVQAVVAADPGGMTPAIQTIWWSTETPQTMIRRINDQLQHRDRWNGPNTIDWSGVFRDLHRAIKLAVAYKHRDSSAPWMLHGGLYELHGEDWAITEAGIEYRPSGQVVLAEGEFDVDRTRMTGLDKLAGWNPRAPEGADPAEWRHVLWRGLFHLPVHRGPVRRQPDRYPNPRMPTLPTAQQG